MKLLTSLPITEKNNTGTCKSLVHANRHIYLLIQSRTHAHKRTRAITNVHLHTRGSSP